ncbi:MAG: efflux RND transporter periplasmic adaptor subunit [Flavobacteriales bacterium]|nr:efflux RND transporter periplasmic adaptor subunit [Flavobacteriales bacterium]
MKTKSLIILLVVFIAACKDKNIIKTDTAFKLTETISKEKELAKVSNETVQSELLLTGKITFDEDKVAKVYPLAGGFVKELTVELGDYVQKGQVMAIIRSPEIAGFTKEGIEAEAQRKSAEKKAKVSEELFKSGIISEVELLEAKKELETATGESKRIQDVLDMYSAGEGAVYPIKSPVSGVVIQKNIALNMELRTEDITPAFVVGSIEDVWVMVNVYESDIAKIKEGYNAEVTTISYPDRVFKGKIDKLFSLMDAESKTLKARVTLTNENFMLKPEMFANVKVRYSENETKKAIPSKALIFDKSKYYVMVYNSDDNIETREVKLFKENENTTYIESGLQENEKVMVKHQLLVYDALND